MHDRHGLHGHTHVPDRLHRRRTAGCGPSSRGPATASALDQGRMLLNPGSVGQPRDGDPRASYLVLDLDAGTATWRRVAYDIDAVHAPDARGRPSGPAGRAPRGTACERHGVIGGRRPLQGRKPGDRRVRVERPHAPYFRYTGPGQLTAKEAASAPTTGVGKTLAARARVPVRAPAGQRGGARRAAEQDEGARDLQLRRDLVVGLRDRGDPRAS